MKKAIFIIILLFISCTINSQQSSPQKIELTGRVIDSILSKPIEFATISLENEKELIGTTSDKNGNFSISLTPGTYTVKIEFLSYTPRIILKKELINNTNLGMLRLFFSAEKLNEIEIVSQKDLMEFKIDKKIYNASKDIANLNGNALDVLNNAPSVRVDDQGQTILRGTKATVLIDGKPLFGLDNGNEFLKSIPSSTIDKVEIITRSAKYSAEGGGGIINIITKKRKGSGLSGSLEAHGGRPDNNGASVFLNENTDKINIFSTISFNNEKMEKQTTIEQIYLDNLGATTGNFEQDRFDSDQRNSFLFNIGSDFYLNNKNTLTTSLLINTNNKNFYSNLTLDDFNSDGSPLKQAIRNIIDFDDISKIETFLNYTREFDSEEHRLTFDFKYDNTVSENRASIAQNSSFPLISTTDQRVKKDQNLDNFLFQLDYSLPIKEVAMLEIGFKSTLKFYKNDYLVSQFDPDLREFFTVGGFDDIVNYDEKIHAFYGVYKVNKSDFSYSFGLRTEISEIDFYDQMSINNYSRKYTDFFPSASLGYEFDNGSYLSLNYSRSIERPQIPQLNPFISVNDERFQSRGNPGLNPFYNDYFELLYDISFEKLSIASALFANLAQDQFLTVIQNAGQNNDGLETYIRTTINSGEKNSYGADLDLTYRPVKALSLRSYVSAYNLDISNSLNSAYDFNSWVWYASFSSLISLDNGLRLQANYIHQSPIQDGQTKLRTINFLNLTLSKTLLKSRGTISFKVNDALNSKWFATRSFEANTNSLRRLKYNRSFILGFTYNFKQSRKSAKDRSTDLVKDELEDKQDKKM